MARRERETTASQEPDKAERSERDGDWQTRLADAMQARNLSGGELARRAGFTAQYVNSLRSGDRGARLPLETARRLAHALGVSVEWLTRGEGPRERLSDVFIVGAGSPGSPGTAGSAGAAGGGKPHAQDVRLPVPSDLYPSRAEAIALLARFVDPEIIDALRAVVPDGDGDPGRDFWIAYAKDLARDLRRIKDDPDLNTRDAPPKSAYVPLKKK